MGSYDDALRLRAEDRAWDDDLTRTPGPAPAGAPTMVAVTVAVTSYPTSAARFYGIRPRTVLGTESEGSSGTLTTITQTLYALNLGASIPPSGKDVVCTFLGNRWVFRWDS